MSYVDNFQSFVNTRGEKGNAFKEMQGKGVVKAEKKWKQNQIHMQ